MRLPPSLESFASSIDKAVYLHYSQQQPSCPLRTRIDAQVAFMNAFCAMAADREETTHVFVRHSQVKVMLSLPFLSVNAAVGLLKDVLVRPSAERGTPIALRCKAAVKDIPISELCHLPLPKAIRDGNEYVLVLDTAGMHLDKLLEVIEFKRQYVRTHRRLKEVAIRALEKDLIPDICWSTCHIEGNTLTRNEVRILLEHGIMTGAHMLEDYTEVQGAAAALASLLEAMAHGSLKDMTAQSWQDLVLRLHKLLGATAVDECGVWRQVAVKVGDGQGCPPAPQLPALMHHFFSWLVHQLQQCTARGATAGDYLTLACEAHMRFVVIHPFSDGNGRVVRLLVSAILLPICGLPVFSVPGEIGGTYYDVVGHVHRQVELHGTAAYCVQAAAERGAFGALVRLCAVCVNEALDMYVAVMG